jgi:hypothetical protein
MARSEAEIRALWINGRVARWLSLAALTAAAAATWYQEHNQLPGGRWIDNLGATLDVYGRPGLIGSTVGTGLFWLACGRRPPRWDSLVLVSALGAGLASLVYPGNLFVLLGLFDSGSMLEGLAGGWYCFGNGFLLGEMIGSASWLAIYGGGWLVTRSRRRPAISPAARWPT